MAILIWFKSEIDHVYEKRPYFPIVEKTTLSFLKYQNQWVLKIKFHFISFFLLLVFLLFSSWLPFLAAFFAAVFLARSLFWQSSLELAQCQFCRVNIFA
jgi:hypothetical protein